LELVLKLAHFMDLWRHQSHERKQVVIQFLIVRQ